MKVLAGSSNELLASRLAMALSTLSIKYIEPRITYFDDSEIKVEIQESLHNEEIIVVQFTLKPVNIY
ncbi:ribose-phosphate pyrophosphokinase-like domain-containing protein [Rickettsia oklahomensis]|uniref:Ribose-phosphate pyrophosphokinase-like domain-containing protein n=1 Tax=Rickettsia oklahomensis TaxID=3141789 RepID=A0AAU7BZR4_9RICK